MGFCRHERAHRDPRHPLGSLTLRASAAGVNRCTFGPLRPGPRPSADSAARVWLDLARCELDAYFAGELREFTGPVDLQRVSPLQRRILAELRRVGYGSTTTYGNLAQTAGVADDGPRQVGSAMARNPVLIIVPCHRVLGACGKLVGYADGLLIKRQLLDLEAHDRTLNLMW